MSIVLWNYSKRSQKEVHIKLKPTIYDIAKKLMSPKSTVSRVLNNQPNISDKAKASVLQAIKELKL